MKARLTLIVLLVCSLVPQFAWAQETTETAAPSPAIESQEDTSTVPVFEVVTLRLPDSVKETRSEGQSEWTFQVRGLPLGTGSVPMVVSFETAKRKVVTGTVLEDGRVQEFIFYTDSDILLDAEVKFNLPVQREQDPELVLAAVKTVVPDDSIPWEPEERPKAKPTADPSSEQELPYTGGNPLVLLAGVLSGLTGAGLKLKAKHL